MPQSRMTQQSGNTKGGSITVPLTSCFTGLESAVWQLTIFVFICKTDQSQTSQTGGQQYSDTSPFSIPWLRLNSRESGRTASVEHNTFNKPASEESALNISVTKIVYLN